MKILFEKYAYNKGVVANFRGLNHFESQKGDTASISSVGYYYSREVGDSVFILPKVFIKNGKAFGQAPSDLIDLQDKSINNELYKLSVWVYRSIERFMKRNPDTGIVKRKTMTDVSGLKGQDSALWIDIIERLRRFNREHRSMFTFITRVSSSGYNKINWHRTISKSFPVIQKNVPVYLKFSTKVKRINYDEELIVLFYSVLSYLKNEYGFKVELDLNYPFDHKRVEQLIRSGKGTRLLRTMRKNYYRDDLVQLWHLLYAFFCKAQQVETKGMHEEYLLASSFDRVFEDMVDQLVSDDTKDKHPNLKNQPDGKLIDHIYKDTSLVNNKQIYFIGDSKYYKDDVNTDDYSEFKQFTYARNVLEMVMDKDSKWPDMNTSDIPKRENYYDYKTEGYTIIPNFFIRGDYDDKVPFNYDDPELKLAKTEGEQVVKQQHHRNRLFDRDTLFVHKFSINFLYVLRVYANGDKSYQDKARKVVREELLSWYNDNYWFYLLTPISADFLQKHLRQLLGKIYSYDNSQYLLALEKKGKSCSDIVYDCFLKANINRRELSSLKVIDFKDKTTTAYLPFPTIFQST